MVVQVEIPQNLIEIYLKMMAYRLLNVMGTAFNRSFENPTFKLYKNLRYLRTSVHRTVRLECPS